MKSVNGIRNVNHSKQCKKENKISQVSKFSKQHLKSKIRKASLIPMNI